jgi:alanine dehydrogenase
MNIGVPRERRVDEHRVGLTPAGVALLTAGGHPCSVEHDAGRGAGFSDEDYEKAGGRIVYSPHEAYGRADIVFKVGPVEFEETEWLHEGAIIMGFLHLAAGRREAVDNLLARKITAIAYETIQQDDGALPVLTPLSQIAGAMAPQIAARLLQNDHGGTGILLGGVPGVPPAEVVVVGGGSAGAAAARAFLGIGSSVYVLDRDLARLQHLDESWGLGRRAVMMVSHNFNVRKVLHFADVVVGAVLLPGRLAPQVITRDMVQGMKPRSILIDVAIDQGGCAETSRPTTHEAPTFVAEGVTHYCVPNMTSVVARTATHAFNNAAWPFMCELVRKGLEVASSRLPALRRGIATHDGKVVNPALASHLGLQEGTL